MEQRRRPSGVEIVRSCLSCSAREQGVFCQLGPDALTVLHAIRQNWMSPRGAQLFAEGDAPLGLFVLCSGRVKLTASSRSGRSLILHIAGPGDVLGLSAVMSDTAYDVSATTVELAQLSFIPHREFLSFLQHHGEVAVRVAQQLASELRRAYHQVSRIALAPTARAKLAGLLLDWAGPVTRPADTALRFPLALTHGEIGEIIGCSRETVTRLLAEFRRQALILASGRFVTIPDPRKLEQLVR